MNSEGSHKKDDRLRNLLSEWEIKESLPPRFQEAVWSRISRAEQQEERPGVWKALKQWLASPLPQPAFAVTCALMFITTGIAAGYWQGHQHATRMDTELGMRYLRSINPYQAPALAQK